MTTQRPEVGRAEQAIVRHLEHATRAGYDRHDVYRDWLAIVEATLRMRPHHERSLRTTGKLADEQPDVVALFVRIHERYPPPYFDALQTAYCELVRFAEIGIRDRVYHDMLGNIYMSWGWPNDQMGQYFTPYDMAVLSARLTVDADELHRRLKAAIAESPLATAALLTLHVIEDEEEAQAWYLARVIPAAVEHYDPITVVDSTCGSGVLLLAAASLFPTWAVQLGLVRFYGQDLDHTCVLMAKANLMLYRLDGSNAAAILHQAELVVVGHKQSLEASELLAA